MLKSKFSFVLYFVYWLSCCALGDSTNYHNSVKPYHNGRIETKELPDSFNKEMNKRDKVIYANAQVQTVNPGGDSFFDVENGDRYPSTIAELITYNLTNSWELAVIIGCSAAVFLTFIIVTIFIAYQRKSKVINDPEIPEPKHVVFQPVVKPELENAHHVQPNAEASYCYRTKQIDVIPPYAVRIKAKGLLERRGSNASLTLDLNPPRDSPHAAKFSRECNIEEYLQSAGNRMNLKQLQMCLNETKALHYEFWEIPTNHQEKSTIPGSGTKNRYRTILPNEETRVKLQPKGDDLLNTYINANYIRGYEAEERVYIATQGPMPHTIDDFWSMIWTEKVPIIVMITKHKENYKVKCECYIPDHFNNYGDITVTVTKFTPKEGYCIRELNLQRGDESMKVVHYWYTAWPDHKTPSTGKQLLMLATDVEMMRRKCGDIKTVDLLQQGQEQSQLQKGPVAIHCSAGIGRTGCFIALSIGMQQILEEAMVDVLSILCQMRIDRGGMVQTAEQYEFIHQTLSLFASTLPPISPHK